MAKRTDILAPAKNEQGQISIFFSASLIVLISIVAFVINIGLFVKAKINLQNATDAAAFSGAAVQARQLSKIAYLNWEMRNIYKEWLYKYYVIGNLNIADVKTPAASGTMNFRLERDVNVLDPARSMDDQYNIPAVCIHIAGSKTNICKRYAIPGLPEFGSSNLPGAEEASRAFLDTLIATKVNDCVDRTRLNMLVANTWTYNVLANDMDGSLAGRGPAILADRQGAWPRAVELAIRMRNLEYIMNRPAETQRVCNNAGDTAGLVNCQKSITDIMSERRMGNERIVKAFYSGYRNLGNATDIEMKRSFTLTEIPPQKVPSSSKEDASYLLIPESNLYEKQWVDLKLMMVNYAIFYAAMIPRADSATSGACDVTKVAIPVPGYPMGFYKNPDVVTYYAVRGEAEFTGMFNPFRDGIVKLTAYAAAKPFGGRIGPALFIQKPNTKWFVGRSDKRRSQPFITSFNFVGAKKRFGGTLAKGEFEPGVPLPYNATNASSEFWLDRADGPIGGLIADAAGVQFGLPNMVYDFPDNTYTANSYTSNQEPVHTIKAADTSSDLAIGLYSKQQFSLFRGNLTDEISPEQLDQEIARVRAPNSYEAANYMIPTPNDFNIEEKLDSFGFVSGDMQPLPNGITRYQADIYAPLFKQNTDQTDLLYENPQSVISTITSFMAAQETGIVKYKNSLNQAARAIYNQIPAGGAQNSIVGYQRAAAGVSDIDFNNPSNEQNPKSCASIAGQFLYFFYEGVQQFVDTPDTTCPKPLLALIQEYFNATGADQAYNPTHYRLSFSWPTTFKGAPGKKMLSAYVPGPLTGVRNDGTFDNPIPGSNISEVMQRNFYSTKFVALDSLLGAAGYNEQATNFAIMSEGSVPSPPGSDKNQTSFKNLLNPNEVGADLTSIKY